MTEDYWLRILQAEGRLLDKYVDWKFIAPASAKLCRTKALQLSDRYHEHWNPTLYRLEK